MSRTILIATAGHVDHGKSSLVRCLTGTDPDRFAEEKKRGITIDLGYAHMDHQDRRYAFVDVPGHERFVHNMLAGVGALDGALLIVAADESVMPQTREHVRALHFLKVPKVVVVLTKIDLVDEEMTALLHEELDDFLAEYDLQDSLRVPFSSKQPETWADLKEALTGFEKRGVRSDGPFRMSVDRVFSSKGSGTVVTGTVERGSLAVDSQVQTAPSQMEAKVRRIQQQGDSVEKVGPLTRTALNLSGLKISDVNRGDLIIQNGELTVHGRFLVKITPFLEDWQPGPKQTLHVHHLAAHLLGRFAGWDPPYALLETEHSYGFWIGDRGLIRDGSPLTICAGFEVIHPAPGPVRLRKLQSFYKGLPEHTDQRALIERHLQQLREPATPAELSALFGLPTEDWWFESLEVIDGKRYLPKALVAETRDAVLRRVKEGHAAAPMFPGVDKASLISGLQSDGFDEKLIIGIMQKLQRDGELIIEGADVRGKNHRPFWPPRQKELLTEILATADEDPPMFDFNKLPRPRKQYAELERLLSRERFLVFFSETRAFEARFLNHIISRLHQTFENKRPFTVQDLKALFGWSRKPAIAVLESLDRLSLTRREGDARVFLAETCPTLDIRLTLPEN